MSDDELLEYRVTQLERRSEKLEESDEARKKEIADMRERFGKTEVRIAAICGIAIFVATALAQAAIKLLGGN